MRSIPILALLTIASASFVTATHAQESVLWKATNKLPPVVVPPYNGEESPFPAKVITAPVTSETAGMEEEAERLRRQAFEQAQAVIASGRGVEPFLDGIRVGAMVEGLNGRRVLVANRWLGIGTVLPVRVTRSAAVTEAIKTLATYDATASGELNRSLDAEIAANPTTPLTLREIRKDSLVFESKYGRKVIDFKINSR